MRIRHKVILKVADDVDMKDLLFQTDETLAEVIIDGFEKQVSGILKVPASTAWTVSFGDVAAVKGVYLRLNQEATVTINGATPAIQLRKSTANIYAKLFLECDISSLVVTSPAGADTHGVFCCWGDAA